MAKTAKPASKAKSPPKKGRNKNQLSPHDRRIIDSYKMTMEGLAAYFGEAFEFVLHDLTDYNHSIIKIMNGFHSGRGEGSPITDLALSLLERIRKGDISKPFTSYTSNSKYGKPVRSATIVIFGEKQKAVGLLCVNLYLDSPLSSLLRNFFPPSQQDYVTENFSSDSDELIAGALEKVKTGVEADNTVPVNQKNKEIVALLYHQGIFRLKNAVQAISRSLGISKNTVYLHIRTLEEK
jgi:predicted transcriptional regulator YheO